MSYYQQHLENAEAGLLKTLKSAFNEVDSHNILWAIINYVEAATAVAKLDVYDYVNKSGRWDPNN
jgi:mannose/cellobiose epimerase-like protein (N-acyl-D-glucosamine 2-epimerase family)